MPMPICICVCIFSRELTEEYPRSNKKEEKKNPENQQDRDSNLGIHGTDALGGSEDAIMDDHSSVLSRSSVCQERLYNFDAQ
jgi:hypothetical protein